MKLDELTMQDSDSQLAGDLQKQGLTNPKIGNGESKEVEEKSGIFNRMKRLVGLGRNGSLRENLENELLRDDGEDSADFSPEERLLLSNILKFRKVRVSDVMVPRADIDAIEIDVSLGQLIDKFRISGHSRMPVFKNNLDDPKGMVHIKDVMDYICECGQISNIENGEQNEVQEYELEKVDLKESIPINRLVRKVLFVPPSMQVTDLMVKMQTLRTQMALVIDEYGGTDGLVSLEDIVEIVFGDIEDEHDDDEEPLIEKIRDNIWMADARVNLKDAREVLGEEFCSDSQMEEIDTLGGVLFTLAGRIPVRGEMITSTQLPGFEFEVIDADQRRIKRMKIYQRRIDQRKLETRKSNHRPNKKYQQL